MTPCPSPAVSITLWFSFSNPRSLASSISTSILRGTHQSQHRGESASSFGSQTNTRVMKPLFCGRVCSRLDTVCATTCGLQHETSSSGLVLQFFGGQGIHLCVFFVPHCVLSVFPKYHSSSPGPRRRDSSWSQCWTDKAQTTSCVAGDVVQGRALLAECDERHSRRRTVRRGCSRVHV